MEKKTTLMQEDSHAAYRRLQYWRAMSPMQRNILEHSHQCNGNCSGQQEPEAYKSLMITHGTHVQDYQALRQFYEQLMYAADADRRLFTFRDETTYSACFSPRIIVDGLSEQQSMDRIWALQDFGKTEAADSCGMGAWHINTADDRMLAELRHLDNMGSFRVTWSDTCKQFTSGLLTAEVFNQLSDIILRYQGDYVLPFANDHVIISNMRRQTPRLELQLLENLQDAWL